MLSTRLSVVEQNYQELQNRIAGEPLDAKKPSASRARAAAACNFAVGPYSRVRLAW